MAPTPRRRQAGRTSPADSRPALSYPPADPGNVSAGSGGFALHTAPLLGLDGPERVAISTVIAFNAPLAQVIIAENAA